MWVTNRHDTQREQYENNVVMTGVLEEHDSVTHNVTGRCIVLPSPTSGLWQLSVRARRSHCADVMVSCRTRLLREHT